MQSTVRLRTCPSCLLVLRPSLAGLAKPTDTCMGLGYWESAAPLSYLGLGSSPAAATRYRTRFQVFFCGLRRRLPIQEGHFSHRPGALLSPRRSQEWTLRTTFRWESHRRQRMAIPPFQRCQEYNELIVEYETWPLRAPLSTSFITACFLDSGRPTSC